MTTDDGTLTPNPEFTGTEGVRLSARLCLVADAQGLTTPKPTRNGGRLV